MFYSDNPVRDAERWLAYQDKQAEAHRVGRCAHCGDDIFGYEEYYDFDGDLVHEDCLHGWAQNYKKG